MRSRPWEPSTTSSTPEASKALSKLAWTAVSSKPPACICPMKTEVSGLPSVAGLNVLSLTVAWKMMPAGR